MKAKLVIDKKRRQLLEKYELKRKDLKKSLITSAMVGDEASEILLKKLRKLPRNSSLTRIRNRCIQTGKARSPLRKFKVSRLEFRRKALQHFFPGLKKASWL